MPLSTDPPGRKDPGQAAIPPSLLAAPSVVRGLTFHHVGQACRSIASQAQIYAHLGFEKDGDTFLDPHQGVRGEFWRSSHFVVEILEPTGANSKLHAYLRRSMGMYHQAFFCDSFSRAQADLRKLGALPCGPASPATAFAGRQIVFFALRGGLLVELIEAAP